MFLVAQSNFIKNYTNPPVNNSNLDPSVPAEAREIEALKGFNTTTYNPIPPGTIAKVDHGANFEDRSKLDSHFNKHGREFRGEYSNADEYLQGARDVMQNGIKVQYNYKGEVRTGYVRFMGNTAKGQAKFEFVGTNAKGKITTYHVESGKTFWKMLNGENIPEINPVD